jgi:hypothetical protein
VIESLDSLVGPATVGNDAGWTLAFHKENPAENWRIEPKPYLVLGRDDYYAEIEAALPGDYSGGKYAFVIEGMTDAHYRKIDDDDVVRLYLYWRDTNATPAGYLASVGGLTDQLNEFAVEALKDFMVAELVIASISRRVGRRRYETVVDARERAFVRVRDKVLQGTLKKDTFGDAAIALTENVNVPVEFHGFTPSGTLVSSAANAHPGDDSFSADFGQSEARVLTMLGDAIEAVTEKHGRGMLLIRDGRIHVGPREIVGPLHRPVELTHRDGLVQAVKDAPQMESTIDGVREQTGPNQYRLTMKGRPDLKPGHVVSFVPAPEDLETTEPASALGAVVAGVAGPLLAEEAVEEVLTLYVNSVQHKLGRASGFVTTLSGVALEPGEDGWDATAPPGTSGLRGASASTSVGAARTIRSVALDAAAAARAPEVGEVRAANTATHDVEEPPPQTLTVWRGLTRPDGRGNQARRLDIRRKNPAVFEGVAYASPFAWGMCGLVLPRYPGTRVLMVHRNGEPRDPVEIGALWESGKGPDSEPGDWWLILPAGIPADRRASIADSETPPEEWFGTATNDLIDADGNRVIEVGELTVRVGRLRDAGMRPKRAPLEHGVTIEHKDGGARITIGGDGKIVIEAAADLELVSKQGDIKLKAETGSLDVKVANAMNVT